MSLATASVVRDDVFGDKKVTVTNVTFDSSYPTNGEALTAADLGLGLVAWSTTQIYAKGANGPISAYYDIPTSKLKALTATGEVANATDLSACSVQVVAYGY